ncbi:MAG: hypothetical protein A3J76_02670 [Candidatus Moranbacteria bacterium RBG_13_45_13]|nr:MAG: hypothetical protein A3J76_02670 [Candidatus Moranbacteria bacterium RBG_13_45_13]
MDKIPANEQMTRKMELFRFESKLVDDAVQKMERGIPYSLSDYFRDLTASCRKSEELFGTKGMNFADSPMGKLQRMVERNRPRGLTSQEVEMARAPHKEYLDAWIKGDHAPVNWGGVRTYLWFMYFRYMFLSAILFFLWVQERHRKDELVLPNPLSFILITAFYPIVIGHHIFRWFRREGRSIIAEAEIRRMNRLYAYISPEDLERIKLFAKSNLSLAHWRQQLSGFGLKPRHSFAAALLVSLIFVFVIRPAEAGAKSMKNFAGKNVAIEQIEATKNLARSNIAGEKMQQRDKFEGKYHAGSGDLAMVDTNMSPPVIFAFALLLKIFLFATDHFQKIFHVPLSAVRHEAILIHPQT